MKNFFTTKLLFVLIFNLIIFNTLFGQTTPICTPTTTPLCTFMGPPNFPFYLGSFTLNSVGPINSSPNCTGYSTNTTAFSSSNLTPGQSYSINITEGGLFTFNYKIAIWFDINNDGDFVDVGEELFQGNSSSVVYNGNITIPNATTSGLHYMRVMIHNNQSATLTPCGIFSLGETEDYVVQIAGGCTPTISSNSPVSVGGSIALTSTIADTYSWTGLNSFTSSQQNPTKSSAILSDEGIYSLSITTGTCTATATTNVVVNPLPSLIAHYRLDGNASDASENNLHGVINGTVTTTTDRFGNPNGAMNFQGNSSSYILVNDNPILKPRNITISVWIKPTSTGSQSFVGKVLANCYNNSWSLGSDGSTLSSWVWTTNTGCGEYQNIIYPSFPLNNWVLLTQVIDDDNNFHKFYVNGTLVSTQELNTSIIYDSSPVLFGLDSDGSGYPELGNYFQGDMDDIRLYNYALNDSEIATIYNFNCTPTISSNSPICEGNTLILSSSSASTYAWVGPNGFSSTGQNVAITNANATNAGVYTLTVDNGIGCTATATTNVVISTLPNIAINGNSPLCVGNTINLSATNSNNTGNSGSFNISSNQFVDVPQTLPIDNFTIEMWIKTSQSDGGLFETGAGPGGSPEGDKFIYLEGGLLKARIIPVPISGLSSGITVNDNNWHHVAVTQTSTGGEGTKIYIDGTFAADYPNSTQCASMPKFQIGTECNLGWQNSNYRTFYNGLIDNVRVWDVVKNATQIAQGMNEDSPSNTPNLVYYQKFENNVNATVGTNGTTPNGLSYTNVSNATYAWAGPNGFSNAGQNITRNSATLAFGGIYTVSVTNASGCSATATTNVVINNLPNPSASSNTPVCIGGNITLSASGGTSYLWAGPNGFSGTGQNITRNSATLAFGGIYTVSVTNVNGCLATATTGVIVNSSITTTTSSNSPICIGSTLNLTANGGASYSWTGPNGFTSTLQNPTRPNALTTFGGIYTVTATSGSCSGTATISVVINSSITSTASSNSPICEGGTLNLSANGGTNYFWAGPNGFTSTLQNPPRTSVIAAFGGVYSVTVNGGGCSATATTNVIISNFVSPPNVSFEPCNGELFKLWDKSFGGSGFDEMIKIVNPSYLGGTGLLLAGNSSSNINIGGGKTEDSKGLQDFWIVNVNGFDGIRNWDRTLGGSQTETLTSALIVSGGYLLGGYTDSGISGDVSEASRGGIDYWVIKVDFNGNKIWDKRFGGSGEDKLHAIITTPDGFLLGGQSNSDISGDRTQNSRGGSDFWAVKIDNDGNKIWDKRFGGNSTDNIYTMYNYGSNFLLGGTSLSDQNGDKTQPSQGAADFWLVNIDTNGNKIWDKRFGGNQTDQLWTITPTTGDGGILLGGTSYSDISGDQTQQRKGILGDFWVVKLNSLGNKVWDKRYGGDNHDFLTSTSITTDGNGGFLLGGFAQSGQNGDFTQPNNGLLDFQVVKIDDNGNKIWDKKFGGAGSDYLNSIYGTTGSGQVYLGGGNGNFLLTKTVACRGEANICIGQSINISATNCAGTINWSNGATSSSITVNSNGTYAATCTSNGGCTSLVSNTITVTTNAPPTQPTALGQIIVAGNSATLNATGCTNYKWYTQPTGGFSVFNGEYFMTPILNSNTNYYVSCDTRLPCESVRTLVPVTVTACPSNLNLVTPNYNSQTITRQASATNGLITATNQVTNTARVTYQSKAILLNQGFVANPISGGVFKAEIGGCN